MRILLTGASGQLGTELRPVLGAMGEVSAADIVSPTDWEGAFHKLDFSDPDGLDWLLQQVEPDVIVNAAAYTAVDRAESETAVANAVNAAAAGRVAEWASAHDAFLLHYSTDYVFDGKAQRPYVESDSPSPLNAYGESKLAGEQAIRVSGCRHAIIRTSWLYSAHGHNFLRTMLRLGRERSHLNIVSDQHGCPTWARNLARVSGIVVERMGAREGAVDDMTADSGIYHYCDRPATTWYDFAQLIFRAAAARGLIERLPQVEAVTSSQFQTAAMRPRNSVLDTGKIERVFRIEPARLEPSLEACLEDIQGQ